MKLLKERSDQTLYPGWSGAVHEGQPRADGRHLCCPLREGVKDSFQHNLLNHFLTTTLHRSGTGRSARSLTQLAR